MQVSIARDFSPRSGKGGASAPPQQDIPSYPRVSRPEQFVRSSCAGRETKRELAAASSAGLKPRPSDRPMKATKSGEKSGLGPWTRRAMGVGGRGSEEVLEIEA